MEAAERQHKVIAISITLIIHVLLLLLFIIIIFRTPIPPFPESGSPGLEINFGNMLEGTGDTEANGIGDATPTDANTNKTEKTTPTSDNKNVLTNDTEESITIKKTENPNTTDNKTENSTEKTAEQTPSSELAQALNKLKNKKSGTGGDGNSGNKGNDGDPNGKPDGTGPGGKGYPNYDLIGRVMIKKPQLVDDSQEEGKVVVEIIVDKTGKVMSAVAGSRGSTTTSALLFAKARQAALSTKFNESPNGADEQKGSISFIFILN